MKRKIRVEKEFDIAVAECEVFARYWEDSDIDGIDDDAENPKMPCVSVTKHFHHGKKQLAWCPVIDLDRGCILNWPVGRTASIHYKSCDENRVVLRDRNGDIVKDYNGYVPKILDPHRDVCDDYVIMEVDSNGYIMDFDNNLDDIFSDDED